MRSQDLKDLGVLMLCTPVGMHPPCLLNYRSVIIPKSPSDILISFICIWLSQDDLISLSCISICNKPFSPDKETQRFCLNCNRWYHTRCLQVLSPPGSIKSRLPSTQVHPDFTDELFKALLCCPIERGITAGVSGNGWAMCQIRRWYSQLIIKGHPLPHDWIIHLDQVDTRWIIPTKQLATTIYYQCPTCLTFWL